MIYIKCIVIDGREHLFVARYLLHKTSNSMFSSVLKFVLNLMNNYHELLFLTHFTHPTDHSHIVFCNKSRLIAWPFKNHIKFRYILLVDLVENSFTSHWRPEPEVFIIYS